MKINNAKDLRCGVTPVQRAYLGSVKVWERGQSHVLPDAYEQVAYLKATGTQYIDTGLPACSGIGCDIRFQTNSPFTHRALHAAILAGRNRQGNAEWQICTYNGSGEDLSGQFIYGSQVMDAHIIPNEVNEIRFRSGVYTANGTSYEVPEASFDAGYHLTLFAGNDGANGPIQFATAKLYLLRMYLDEVLVRDFVPCVRKSDGKPGLYDLVDGAFYTNVGTGEFLIPRDTLLPEGYTQAEAVASTGTRCIDTGIVMDEMGSVEITAAPTAAIGGWGWLCGAGERNVVNSFDIAVNGWSRTTFQRGTGLYHDDDYAFAEGEKYTFRTEGGSLYINDVLQAALSETGAFTTFHTLYLLADHMNDGVSGFLPCRLYGAKIRSKSTVLRDFVPCIRDADGAAGLYDVVSERFFENVGMGAFVAVTD